MSDRNFQTGGMRAKSGAGAGSAARGKQSRPVEDSAKAGKRESRPRRPLPESIRKIVEEAEARYGKVFDSLAKR